MARSGHVYVMDFGEGRVKVGFSKKPETRAIVFRRAPVLHISDWSDSADIVERAAHKLLDLSGLRIENEIFRATLDQAVAAINKAFDMLANGSIPPQPPRPNRRKKMIGFRFDADLLDRLNEWRDTQDPRPTMTWVFETALREFFDKRGFKNST